MTFFFRRGGAFVTVERNVILAGWQGPPELPQLAALGQALAAIDARTPGRGALFSVVAEVRGVPPLRLEAASLTRLSFPEGSHLGAAHVVLPRGLVGAGVRAVLGTMGAMMSSRGPSETFDTLAPGAEWLAERLAGSGETWSAAALLDAHAAASARAR